MASHELVIRNGVLIDGTGSPRRRADVAIDGDRIAEVGLDVGAGRREIDAADLLVTPGFVDIHTHYDGQVMWDRYLTPSSSHGVTTVVTGNCGVGFAPVRSGDAQSLVDLMEGVEDIPGSVLHEGLTWDWTSFAEYLDAIDARTHDIDVATQVPHAALRLFAMGPRGAIGEEVPTDDEIECMGTLARDAVLAGALGFSTSRTRNHRAASGRYTPTLGAEERELMGIARSVAATGRGVMQGVSDFFDDAEFMVFRRLAAETGLPTSVSVLQSSKVPERWRELLNEVSKANAEGVRILAQVGCRPVGVILGLDCSLHPFMQNPAYLAISGLPPKERAERLRDPATKESVMREVGRFERGRQIGANLITRFDRMYEMSDPPDYEPRPESSLAARASAIGVQPESLAYDILVAGEGTGLIYSPLLNYAEGNLDAVREMIAHPYAVPGLSDGGAHVGTICDGSFPTTLLQYWGRDREGGFSPEFLLQRQCQATARAVGLLDRGVVAPGYKADLNIIDFDKLGVRRPRVVRDLPAGGRRLLQTSEGFQATVVNGRPIIENGLRTDELPGRLVRGQRPGPDGGIV